MHQLLDQVHRCSESILLVTEAFTWRGLLVFLLVFLTFGTLIHWIQCLDNHIIRSKHQMIDLPKVNIVFHESVSSVFTQNRGK